MPLFNTIQQYGSKRRHLHKYRKSIDRFFVNNIDSKSYMSEATIKYQKRFKRYRNSLFTFLSEDNIPWNNNMAERAIRHLAIQRKISGTFFDSLVSKYLLLLGITQSCRFQGKPPLAFFLSEYKDVDSFKAPKPKRYTKRIRKKVVERS